MDQEVEKIEQRVSRIKGFAKDPDNRKPRNWVPLFIVVVVVIMLINWFTSPTRVETLADVPEFSGKAYVVLQRNVPNFDESNLDSNTYVSFSELDELGRAGAVMACIGPETMQETYRDTSIDLTPAGWQDVSYDNIDGGVLYQRSELIGYQMTGADEDARNLITGTSFMYAKGLSYIESLVGQYVLRSGNHVIYRATPIYEGDNLVASGVRLEALSIEDGGEGVCFHLYLYNNQPGITIDYATGASTQIGK